MSLLTRRIHTPVGTLTAVASATALRALLWPDDPPGRVLIEPDGPPAGDHALLKEVEVQLGEYFTGSRRTFEVPLRTSGTQFQDAVWSELRQIRYGRTATYGQVAAAVGRSNAARAVGGAVGRNPISVIVPCHRVVGSDGSLTGFAGGLSTKRWLLRHEAARSQS